jgi:hypothetical protein
LKISITGKHCGQCQKDFYLFEIVNYVNRANASYCDGCIAAMRMGLQINPEPRIFMGEGQKEVQQNMKELIRSYNENFTKETLH